MDTKKKLKQMAFIGLACICCVAVTNYARKGSDEAGDYVGHLQNEPASVPQKFHAPADRLENRFSSARRIPSVDDATRAYPVQLAAFDSIPWSSDVVTPDQTSPPIAKTSDTQPRRPRMANLPAEPTPDQFGRTKANSAEAPLPHVNYKETNKQSLASAGQKPSVIGGNDFQPSGQRIAGLWPSDASESQNDEGQFEVDEISLNPDYIRGPATDSNDPTWQPSFAGNAPIVIKGISPAGDPPLEKKKSPEPAQPAVPTRGNSNRVVVANPYYQPSPGTDRPFGVPEQVVAGGVNVSQSQLVSSDNDWADTGTTHSFESTIGAADEQQDADGLAQVDAPAPGDSSIWNQPVPNSQPDDVQRNTGNNGGVATNISFKSQPSNVTKQDPTPASSVLKQVPRPLPQPQTGDRLPSVLQGASNFVLAGQPKFGDHWNDDHPVTDPSVWLVDPIKEDFSPDPIAPSIPYDPYQEMRVYDGKTLNATQRPIVELGRPWYQLGQLSPGYSWFGKHNNVTPQFLVYGDVRTALGSSTQNGDNVSELAYEVNLDFDLKLTSTERFHMFIAPLDNGVQNARWLLDQNEFVDVYDANIDFGYFEGDLGAMVGGFINQTLPFDLPFAMGVMPLVMQNGVWMEDAFLGVAATIPARNIPQLNVSNMDVTFFAGFDKINSDAFTNDDSAARMYGVASFIDAMNGYFEIDYAYLEDRTFDDRSYHNIGIGFTRRFGRLLSHSSRIIVNAGQTTDVVENSADGVLLLSENSLITSSPSTLVPYMNLFAGFDRPQSAARAVQAGGILRNTGILFESDGMTNYPTLDPTANDTYGGAIGLNLLATDFSQQLVVEMAAMGVMGENANRNAPGGQYGVAFRYQLPLTNSLIFRTDGMYGFLEDSQDVRGLRFELRRKY